MLPIPESSLEIKRDRYGSFKRSNVKSPEIRVVDTSDKESEKLHQSLPIKLDASNRHSLSLGALKRQKNVGSFRTKNDPYMVLRG